MAPPDDDPVFVASIDQGTTSSRVLIFSRTGEPVAAHHDEFPQLYPHPGWHEHDPDELLRSVHRCLAGAFEAFARRGHARAAIRAVGISTQRETTVCWDTATGRALCNALVWTDTRTAGIARELAARARAADVPLQDVCGLPVSAYPSVTKLVWMLRNVDGVRAALEAGTLAFGTVDAWLVYWLNGGPAADVFVTEPTNASRTMFMDLHTLRYSERMLDFFSDAAGVDLRKVRMPSIVRSAHATAFGKLATGPLQGLRITACLGDQSAALVGQKGLHAGCAKNTYGTGCFLLYNVGDTPVISTHGLLATVAYVLDDKPMYALEGSIAVAGSGVRFLTDNLGFEEKSHQISELAETVPDNGGLVFVTAFSGLFAPYWIDDARGTIFGITGHTKRGHIARATLEAVCFQTRAILDAMQQDAGGGRRLTALKVDGGMSNSALCMQTQADLIRIPVERPQMRETTALGAAMAAGLAVGVWRDLDELRRLGAAAETVFEPAMDEGRSRDMFRRWEKAVGMCRGWLGDDGEEGTTVE